MERGAVLTSALAAPIVGQTPDELSGYTAANPEGRPARWSSCARSRFAEDRAEDALRPGVTQLVVPRGGTRHLRPPHPFPTLRRVELDHRAT